MNKRLIIIFLASFNCFSQITERISGGISYSASLNNWGENSAAADAVVKAQSIDLDSDGNIILAHRNSNDPYGNRIRKINRHTGIISSIAGCSGNCPNILGGSALAFSYIDPIYVTVDLNNDIYFLDLANVTSPRIYKIVALDSTIHLVSGTVGIQCNGFAVLNGEIYYANSSNQIIQLSPNGSQQIIAGNWNGTSGFSQDGTYISSSSPLNNPGCVYVRPNGEIIFYDSGNHRIRKIVNGQLITIAGNGNIGPSCNSCNPLTTSFQNLMGIDVDHYGNIYLMDFASIKKIDDCDGLMQTIGGNGLIGITQSYVNPLNTSIYYGGGLCVDLIGDVNFITKGSVGGSTTVADHIYRIKPQIVLDNAGGQDYHVCHNDSLYLSNSSNNIVDWGYGQGVNPSFLVDSNFYLILTEYDTNGCHLFSDEIEVINVDLPEVTSQIHGYTCGEGTVNIGASASPNASIQWFDNINDSLILYQGFEFVTPFQVQDQTYYAKAIDTLYGCQSIQSYDVNAFISPIDSCTYVPDNNFENKLIFAGIDDQFNDYVKTSMIDTLKILDISNPTGSSLSIQVLNLEGIQDFTLLEKIYANENELDNVDLELLYERTHLRHLYLGNNNIEYFNSSNFIGLGALKELEIQNNKLTCLNLKNNATNNLVYLKYYGNPLLSCIQIDNDFIYWFMNQNTTPVSWYFSPSQTLNNSNISNSILLSYCNTLCNDIFTNDIKEINDSIFYVFPNPNDGNFELFFNQTYEFDQFKILNVYGQVIHEEKNMSYSKKCNFTNLPNGMYFIQIDSFPTFTFIKN
jgi:hypothetical protein